MRVISSAVNSSSLRVTSRAVFPKRSCGAGLAGSQYSRTSGHASTSGIGSNRLMKNPPKCHAERSEASRSGLKSMRGILLPRLRDQNDNLRQFFISLLYNLDDGLYAVLLAREVGEAARDVVHREPMRDPRRGLDAAIFNHTEDRRKLSHAVARAEEGHFTAVEERVVEPHRALDDADEDQPASVR